MPVFTSYSCAIQIKLFLLNMASKRKISTNLVKTVTVRTCVGVYPELRQLYPEYFSNAPDDGLDLAVNYVDTLVDDEDYDCVVVAVHGLSGNYTNFDQLIREFNGTKVRVIAPNLPTFSTTRRTKTFWHTTPEKEHFLRDFLIELNIKCIDCLISHSFGCQTIAALWENVSF